MDKPGHFSDAPVPRRTRAHATVQGDGSVSLPASLAARFGLESGARLSVEELDNHLLIHRPITHLARLYVEPTNECPLSCRTCMRRTWDEPAGRMDAEVFSRIVEGIQGSAVKPTVFFGGIGEPLLHPDAAEMVSSVTRLGARAELITSGLALDERMIDRLVDAGLDTLWVSLDGATEECYESVRDSAALSPIVENLRTLRAEKYRRDTTLPRLGISFVAMKRNQAELSRVIDLGLRLGATKFSISNVQPHSEEMRDEVMNGRTLGQSPASFSGMDLARMDKGGEWDSVVASILAECGLRYSEGRASTAMEDTCPFVERGSMSIRWDGAVSPCVPLLHSHFSWLGNRRREIKAFTFGSLRARSPAKIWTSPDYVRFRERLQDFDFPPCTRCNGCDAVDSNQEDCFGNPAPACGACPWAQGFIVCP